MLLGTWEPTRKRWARAQSSWHSLRDGGADDVEPESWESGSRGISPVSFMTESKKVSPQREGETRDGKENLGSGGTVNHPQVG